MDSPASRVAARALFLVMLAMFACDDNAPSGALTGEDSASAGTAGTPAGTGGTQADPNTAGVARPSGAGITAAEAGASGGAAGGSDMDAGAGNGGTGSSMPLPDAAAGSNPDAGASGGVCTRELLTTTLESYFDALGAHDPALLPLAANVKFTENGERLELGEGLWQDAGMVRYAHSALDTERCTSVSESVVPEGGSDLPVSLRLTLEAGQITEIETIVARPGDYVIFGSAFRSNPDAIVDSASLGWEETVVEAERATRQQLAAWITSYFESFPNGGCDLADECKRLENGGGSFACSLGASCSQSGGGGVGGPMHARLVVVDEVRGIAVGYTMFMGNTDMHMILMRGGEVRAVHAILSGADGPGWD